MTKPPVTVEQAAVIAGCHPETVRRALRAEVLHGNQNSVRGTWKMRPGCVKKWALAVPCKHQHPARPVSLDEYRQSRKEIGA